MIKLVRLVTGEDIIADIEKSSGSIIFKKPHRLIFSKDGLASMPLCPFAKTDEYEISNQHVLFEADPEDEIRNSYAAQVGSIVVPTGLVTP